MGSCSSAANHSVESCGHVVIVIPEADHGPGQIMFVAERAQARRVEQKISTPASRSKRQPASGQNANKVSAGKEQDVSRNAAKTLDHAVRPRTNLFGRFAAWSAIPEQLPIRTLAKDLGRGES